MAVISHRWVVVLCLCITYQTYCLLVGLYCLGWINEVTTIFVWPPYSSGLPYLGDHKVSFHCSINLLVDNFQRWASVSDQLPHHNLHSLN